MFFAAWPIKNQKPNKKSILTIVSVWHGEANNMGHGNMSWEKVYRPKKEGSFGVLDRYYFFKS